MWSVPLKLYLKYKYILNIYFSSYMLKHLQFQKWSIPLQHSSNETSCKNNFGNMNTTWQWSVKGVIEIHSSFGSSVFPYSNQCQCNVQGDITQKTVKWAVSQLCEEHIHFSEIICTRFHCYPFIFLHFDSSLLSNLCCTHHRQCVFRQSITQQTKNWFAAEL